MNIRVIHSCNYLRKITKSERNSQPNTEPLDFEEGCNYLRKITKSERNSQQLFILNPDKISCNYLRKITKSERNSQRSTSAYLDVRVVTTYVKLLKVKGTHNTNL